MKNDKVLLVTGASSEVGQSLIGQVGSQYRRVWAHYCGSGEAVSALRDRAGAAVTPVQADFSDMESTRRMIESIRCSGYLPDHIVHLPSQKNRLLQFHRLDWEEFQKGIDISLRSITLLLLAYLPHMKENRNGKVVFMLSSSINGLPPRFQSCYVTLKYALYGLMRSLAAEYAGKGITVNAVSPDMMETRFLSDIPALAIEQNAAQSPLKRNICVHEVIPAIRFLLSSGSDVITGQNIAVTGGMR